MRVAPAKTGKISKNYKYLKMKKSIDDIYREKLGNSETTPPGDIWQNIAAALPEKKRGVIAPFWYYAGGVAAVTALLFSIFREQFQFSGDYDSAMVQVSRESLTLIPEPASDLYRETMLQASAMLEMLRRIPQHNQKAGRATAKIENVHNPGPFTGMIAEAEIPELSASNYRFSEYLLNETLSENTADVSSAVTESPEPVDLLQKKEEPAVAEKTSSAVKRFSLTTTAAAVYSDQLGRGSAIDEGFAANSSAGEISMAYGINLGYQVSERIKIRTGLNKVSLSHTTQNVNFAAAVNSRAVEAELLSFASSAPGHLNQSLGFIEIPAEVEYALINRKIGLNLIGGASTLFLDENMLTLNSAGFSASLGEANNLNQLSFSANLGLGVNYNFSPSFQFNLEPLFKYQLNTFNEVSGVRPYYFGVYSGLSYKF